MLRIALVNMPFSAIELPSIALTQLRAMVMQRFGDAVEVEICYPSLDVCRSLGLDDYRTIGDEATYSGLGDWLFRRLAFPDLPDNAPEYRQRFFPAHDARRELLERALAWRAGLERLLDDLVLRYRLDRADLVGFTTMFSQTVPSFALARRLKARRPEVVVAIGGANCESPMGEEIARRVDAIDYVFSGPGLISFPELVRCLIAGDAAAAERIDGVFTRRNCADRPAVAVLGAELPIDEEVELDYGGFLDAFEGALAGAAVEPTLLFESSRGCWWGERAHCTFCGLNGSTMSYRAMQPERAIRLFESLFALAPRARRLSCVDNIMPKSYPREVFTRLATPPGVSIFYEVKADLTSEDLALMSAAGVDSVQPGIEALATSTLRLMRKGMTSVRNVRFLVDCLLHDVHPGWNLLVGFPGEGEEVFKKYVEDLPRLVHLPPPSGVFPVRFDRYSPYFTQTEKYGLDLAPFDFYRYVYPFEQESLARLAYYFVDRNPAPPYAVALAKWIMRLRRAVDAWTAAWAGGTPPSLHLASADGSRVHDSRGGAAMTHDLGARGAKLLAALADPTMRAELPKLVDLAPAEIEAELARLRALGLLLEDGERLVSLVLPRPVRPARMLARYAPAEAPTEVTEATEVTAAAEPMTVGAPA